MPIDRSRAKAIADERVKWLRWALGLQDWSIKVYHGALDGGPRADEGFRSSGRCVFQPEYRMATIYMDPEWFDDEGEFLRILLHEFLHIVISPFEQFREIALIDEPGDKQTASDVAYRHAMELTVSNLEILLTTQLGLDVPGLCELAEKHAGRSTRHCPTLHEAENGAHDDSDIAEEIEP